MSFRRRTDNDVLIELAAAVESDTEWIIPSRRARSALNEAWELIDADGERRRKETREAGCVECDGPLELDEEICATCSGDPQKRSD